MMLRWTIEDVTELYYFILILGILFVAGTTGSMIYMYRTRSFKFTSVAKATGAFLLGSLMLAMTLPILKSMVLKDYDVFVGECRVEITGSERFAETAFTMLGEGEQFYFNDIVELDAYGKAVPYYCEVTVSKDHFYGISYKVYDIESRELLLERD